MTRELVTLPVPAGPAALGVLPALRAALDGSGPALLPYDARTAAPILSQEHTGGLPENLAVVIGTSGSTGAPKRAMLTAAALTASAAATADRLGGEGDWLLALPAHHVAGLQVLLRAAAGGGTVQVLPPGPFTPAAFVAGTGALRAAAATARPAYVSLVPTQLGRLVADPGGRRAAATYDAVLVGGAACPPDLLARAREAGLRVVTTYGSSETCGGCVYDGVPLPGARLAVSDGGSAGIATRGQGRVLIAGPMVAAGYLGDPTRTAAAFVTSAGRRWFRTDDLGRIESAGSEQRLRVLGRIDDLIVTGGLKVAPRVVEDAVAALLPDGWGVVAVGVPDGEWGQAVAVAVGPWAGSAAGSSAAYSAAAGAAAGVAPGPGGGGPAWWFATTLVGTADDRLAELRSRLRGALAPAALPRRLLVLDPLPTLGIGKPDRARVRRAVVQAVLTE